MFNHSQPNSIIAWYNKCYDKHKWMYYNGFAIRIINALEFKSFERDKRVVRLFNTYVLLSINAIELSIYREHTFFYKI